MSDEPYQADYHDGKEYAQTRDHDVPAVEVPEDLSPETYPARCTVDESALNDLYALLTTKEDWRTYVEEWPPTDSAGNVYDIWFRPDELNHRGELVDQHNTSFSPFTGTQEPLRHPDDDITYCNSPLSKWRNRYPSIRYCSSLVPHDRESYPYCHLHTQHGSDIPMPESAESMMQTGLHVTTIDAFYEKLSPWKKIIGWGTYEALLGESAYEFAPEYEVEAFDFSEADTVPPQADDHEQVEVKVPYPTEHLNPSLWLYVAAMMTVQMLTVQPRVMYENEAEGQRMMERRTVEHAQLTAPPSEYDSSPQTFQTIEAWEEHHLNKALSRVVRDQGKLLERGGVTTDPEDATDTDVDAEDIVVNIEAEADGLAEKGYDEPTDPNHLGDDYVGQSEKIAASVNEEAVDKPPKVYHDGSTPENSDEE